MIIGCAQALALVPGVSRSGITLVAALAIGLRRDAAARFSFLLGVPAIAAAGIFELQAAAEGARHRTSPRCGRADRRRRRRATSASPGCCASCARARTMPFVVYRIALGALLLVLLISGTVAP